MIFQQNTCKICHLPEGTLEVVLDENNICNYCNFYDSQLKQFFERKKDPEALIKRLHLFKNHYTYDAIVGLSGGKDSTYVLYKLVREYNLNVLAVTYDNGFLTDLAKKNIKTTIDKLGCDHKFYVPNIKAMKSLYTTLTRLTAEPCIACMLIGLYFNFKLCLELQIPFFVNGRSPAQMLATLYEGSWDNFHLIIEQNLSPHSFKTSMTIANQYLNNTKTILNNIYSTEELNSIYEHLFPNEELINENFCTEYVSYFLFHDYDEIAIKKFLAEKLDWKKPEKDPLLSHFDCEIHDACEYLYQEKHGISMLTPEIAAMLRMKVLNSSQINDIYTDNTMTEENIHASVQSLCSFCDFSEGDVKNILMKFKSN